MKENIFCDSCGSILNVKNMALEMFSRDPRRLIATAKRIGLPTDQLELMLQYPDRFEKRKDISIKA